MGRRTGFKRGGGRRDKMSAGLVRRTFCISIYNSTYHEFITDLSWIITI